MNFFKIKICDCVFEFKEVLVLGIKYDYVINDFIELLVDKDKYGEWVLFFFVNKILKKLNVIELWYFIRYI